MTAQRCTSYHLTVGGSGAGQDWRLLPTAANDTLIDGTFCEACWPAALAAVRASISDHADAARPFEAVMPAVLVRAYLQHRDVAVRPPDTLDGLRGIIADALRLLDQIQARQGFWWRRAMCSGCGANPRELEITTLPWWNDGAGDYLTTFRCAACLGAAVADTRARLAANGNDDVARICAMFERHNVFLHEHRRGDPPDVVRPLLEQVLARIETGALVLPIGKTQSIA